MTVLTIIAKIEIQPTEVVTQSVRKEVKMMIANDPITRREYATIERLIAKLNQLSSENFQYVLGYVEASAKEGGNKNGSEDANRSDYSKRSF